MKRMGIASFTQRGGELAKRLGRLFQGEYELLFYEKKNNSLKEWCRNCFLEGEALIFVGACGIAVRTIAPFLQDKTRDPAVLVLDEAGQYVISLVSGHIGGANRLAMRIGEALGAQPVITTATDVNGKFAADVFARENGLEISSMKAAKEVSAAVLKGKRVYVFCDGKTEGELPRELTWWQERSGEAAGEEDALIWISPFLPPPFPGTVLHLIPRAAVLGLGCRKGREAKQIQKTAQQAARLAALSWKSLGRAASVDLKREEPGILEFCEKNGLPYETYSAEALASVPGAFSPSSFVKEITGIENVCERAALAAAGERARLVQKKYAENGVTAALAVREWRVRFGKEGLCSGNGTGRSGADVPQSGRGSEEL